MAGAEPRVLGSDDMTRFSPEHAVVNDQQISASCNRLGRPSRTRNPRPPRPGDRTCVVELKTIQRLVVVGDPVGLEPRIEEGDAGAQIGQVRSCS